MKFLIVDDDISICKLLVFYLSQHARCFYATKPVKALELFNASIKREPFDAVFMDIVMPGFDGHDVVELIRETERTYAIAKEKAAKVVMVSAYDDIGNITRSLYKHNAVCFIRKPFTEEGLLHELRIHGVL